MQEIEYEARNPANPILVYLSGGFRSGWQDQVGAKIERMGARCIDPRKGIGLSPKSYTALDLSFIDVADVVFAYIEHENVAIGAAVEIGYAVAKGKPVIVVVDDEHPFFRYWQFGIEAAYSAESDLDDALLAMGHILQLIAIKRVREES